MTKITYNYYHKIKTPASDMERLIYQVKKTPSHEKLWNSYFLGSDPLIKDNNQNNPNLDKMHLLNFFAQADMGVTSLFETDENFEDFTQLKIPNKNNLLTSPSQIQATNCN